MRFGISPIAVALASVVPALAAAQGRVVERHRFVDPEGRLMAYYSSVLAYTAIDVSVPRRRWSAELGADVVYVPPLGEGQRRDAFGKPEATNLAPVVPRPRAALALPGRALLEASFTPPVRLFDLEANLVGVAISRPVVDSRALRVVPRVSYMSGTVSGAITCTRKLLERNNHSDSVYFRRVCNGRPSNDHFNPRHLSVELVASGPLRRGALLPFAGMGLRRERTRFDIGVIRSDGSRDPDHPILELVATRPFGYAGASWRLGPRAIASSELFYAPGSVLTVRMMASWRFRR
ncbi:MAG: hypothetical protein M3068_04355 [Gemmatimonadota bacterium]|nr:hypothetical protein [Gemmatimonadota bacterium]